MRPLAHDTTQASKVRHTHLPSKRPLDSSQQQDSSDILIQAVNQTIQCVPPPPQVVQCVPPPPPGCWTCVRRGGLTYARGDRRLARCVSSCFLGGARGRLLLTSQHDALSPTDPCFSHPLVCCSASSSSSSSSSSSALHM
ncbi:unnamed protein product [Boreogadus saida]